MATKRGDKSRLELTDFKRTQRKEKNDFIEKVVLPNDTLQGIALLYNTTVADLKKLNHLHSDIELHAHRIIKVPSKGILINLEPETVPVNLSTNDEEELLLPEEEEEVEKNGQLYLKSVDASLKEIREKVETVAANSVLNGSESPIPFRKVSDQSQGELKWWKVFLPCLGTLIVFPILYFIYRHNLFIPVPLHSNETYTHSH